jgi:hypothetical protein
MVRCALPDELRALLSQLDRCFRVMVFLDAATGNHEIQALAAHRADLFLAN